MCMELFIELLFFAFQFSVPAVDLEKMFALEKKW